MLGGPERGAGRLRICERTKLLLVEIDTVACCSPTTGMAAGCRPEPPWTYRRIAGEYAYLEKRFVAELAPPWPPAPPAPPRRLQDFATPPPSGREIRPQTPTARSPPGQPKGTGASGARGWHPPCAPHPLLPGGRPSPPSYEAHMQRVQAAHARRGGPPPYISPPAYNAPHRTLQLRPPRGPRSPPPAPRGRRALRGGWSHTLPRAATEAGHRQRPGMQPSPGGPGTPRHSQTLPRAAAGRERVPGRGRGRRGGGGHVLIDATRVVVRAQYVPPPQRQQVRYAGGSPGPAAPPSSPPAPPKAATPPAAPSPPRESRGSPRSPWRSPGGCGGPRGRPPPRRPALYAQALREAVSRIRRHTAPDSDSEAEGGAGGPRWRRCPDACAYSSSSSSLESAGAPPGATSPPRA
ncbi:dendrin [Balearica regulorum gibbericeps]|uniref:dendrin n=1 Tax=Balearica regulorum gibbericeps TaxID=100784 RepID=UPI003F640A15